VILEEIEDVSLRDNGEQGEVFAHGRPNKVVNDYGYDATLRSIEDSLKRLRTDHIEIAFVHDLAQDFWGDAWLGKFEEARLGAFRSLDRLRDEGVIKAWGLGANKVEPIELLLDLQEPRPDAFLLAAPCNGSCPKWPNAVWVSSSGGPTVRERWWAGRTSNMRRRVRKSLAGSRRSRRSPIVTGCR